MGNEKESYSKLQNLYFMQLQRSKFYKFSMVEDLKILHEKNVISCYITLKGWPFFGRRPSSEEWRRTLASCQDQGAPLL